MGRKSSTVLMMRFIKRENEGVSKIHEPSYSQDKEYYL